MSASMLAAAVANTVRLLKESGVSYYGYQRVYTLFGGHTQTVDLSSVPMKGRATMLGASSNVENRYLAIGTSGDLVGLRTGVQENQRNSTNLPVVISLNANDRKYLMSRMVSQAYGSPPVMLGTIQYLNGSWWANSTGTGSIMQSTNYDPASAPAGGTWTERSFGNFGLIRYVQGNYFSNRTSVASGQYSYSPDGVTWTSVSGGGSGQHIADIVYHNGAYLALTTGFLNGNTGWSILRSTTAAGIWTGTVVASGTETGPNRPGNLRVVGTRVCYFRANATLVGHSTDGITWSSTNLLVSGASQVATGYNSQSFPVPIMRMGSYAIIYFPVMIGGVGRACLWYSTDGSTWTRREVGTALPNNNFYSPVQMGPDKLLFPEPGTLGPAAAYVNTTNDPTTCGFDLIGSWMSNGTYQQLGPGGVSAPGYDFGSEEWPSNTFVASDSSQYYWLMSRTLGTGVTIAQQNSQPDFPIEIFAISK